MKMMLKAETIYAQPDFHAPAATSGARPEQAQPTLSGTHLVPCGIGCLYSPNVEAEDFLMVDFDQRSLHGDGLYLVEMVEADQQAPWRGCRRFQRKPDGWWMDVSGEREWRHIGQVDSIGLRVAGYVREVYKPAKRLHVEH